jgi:ketosteroid isomerase-like protein
VISHPISSQNDEKAVRTLIEAWVSGVQACDLDAVCDHRSEEVVMFDVPPPEDGVRGTAAYRAAWPTFFDWVGGGARFELVELDVTAGTDVAYAWALLRCGTDDDLRSDTARRLRLTLGLRRNDAGWKVAHEHHSFTQR